MQVKRVGVFGGTFDPPHLGHLILAEEIRERFGLTEVYFMPCNEPPHKDRDDLTDAKHRFAMVVAATLHNPAFLASPIEVNRPGESYSIDTVRELNGEMDDDQEIVFISGLDAFIEIETWEGYEEFLNLCHVELLSLLLNSTNLNLHILLSLLPNGTKCLVSLLDNRVDSLL